MSVLMGHMTPDWLSVAHQGIYRALAAISGRAKPIQCCVALSEMCKFDNVQSQSYNRVVSEHVTYIQSPLWWLRIINT
jgi:hypothetical protein